MSDLDFLTDSEKAQLSRLVAQLPLWRPLPGPQTMAYNSQADIIGYGGAGGGGKTDLALGKALNQHSRVAVFRKNGTEHTAFVDRLEEVLGTREGLNGHTGIWRDAGPRKVQIELCSVPNNGDEKKYRGRPHDLKVFDEAAEIPEHQVRFLLAWLRSTIPNQKCQALLCFNPPGNSEGRWVIDFFAPWLDDKHPNPAMPGELRWFAMIDGKEHELSDSRPFVLDDVTRQPNYHFDSSDYVGARQALIIKPQSRTFIPAKVTDNPYYANGAYMSTLQSLPEPLRSQMLHGDFRAGMGDDPWQVMPTAWVEAAMARWKPRDRVPEMLSMGVDVARGGRDQTIIARRHADMWFDTPLVYPGTETPDGYKVAGLVITAWRDMAPIHIDVIGVGSSPYDILNQSGHPIMGVNVAIASHAKDRSGVLGFFNLRSQLIWQMREALDPANNTGIALPPDPRLKADLCAYHWQMHGKTIKVESREDVFDRIKRSPDYASAYVLANIDTPKRPKLVGIGGRENTIVDYNPYDALS